MTATIESMQPTFAIMCPAIVSILILLFGKWPNIRESWTLIAAIAQFLIVISMAPVILAGNIIECTFFTMLPGVDFGFSVDAFGLIFAITSSFLWILVSLYSIGYMRSLNEHAQTRFYFFFALAIFGAVGIAMSGNLFTMFIFYEILTVSTYPLVAHEQTPVALAAGRKYLAYLLTSGTFFLAAIVLTYYFSGTTDFVNGGIPNLASEASRAALMVLFVIFLLGFMKAAWMPFHSWLPTAMAAPTPVSALLHAVAVVKAGVFGIIRVVCYIYGVDLMSALGLGLALVCLATFTLIVANLFALAQDNLKRRLAYSTINQLSLIIFGVALLSYEGIEGAMMHIPFHGFMKITLFMCAGAIMVASGKKNISEMAGIGKKMPVTMIAFTIGALGMCALPPTAGYITHHLFVHGCEEAGGSMTIFPYILLIVAILDVMYFFPIIYTAFFKKSKDGGDRRIQEAPIFMLIPIAITATVSIIFYFYPDLFYISDLVHTAISGLMGGHP
ncbi:MAG: F(420)H(2) dehydrogenase subunit L [Candidatus Argoarchaeum ethanivorans]|uniref:F(420)H(2) dehydrogenase subunit L n=1 Tax=Candidatus Argoarchaeum ethanivorans TaxID=2608793 RepID=A0A811THX3_9EURY|nr:MAG: F(420)H(2) dehydrogenase subunit L [Candidatus Argoarchaeum ethanivorans]CAD6494395.1 MAG: F(420)H(2) dehydrogenase subunit L [Candidatus Argoarchaeum ethanivorans]